FRLEHDDAATLAPVADGAAHAVAVLEQARDGAFHVDVDALMDAVVLQRADHLEPGSIADVGEPRVAMAAEVTLENATVLGAIEERAPTLQLEHALGRLLRMQLRHAPVVEHLPPAEGGGEVPLPVAPRPHVAERGGDAALGHHRVSLTEQRLAHEPDRHTLSGRFDGCAQAGAAGADDDDVVLVHLVVVIGHHTILKSLISPIATRRM